MYPSDSQHLPFFPTPYPGESLYSILCRYYVRCGNISPHRTIRQLFNSYDSLISTLLLPTRLDRLQYWLNPGDDVSVENLLREHTAFSLCKLRTFSQYQYYFHLTDSNAVQTFQVACERVYSARSLFSIRLTNSDTALAVPLNRKRFTANLTGR